MCSQLHSATPERVKESTLFTQESKLFINGRLLLSTAAALVQPSGPLQLLQLEMLRLQGLDGGKYPSVIT